MEEGVIERIRELLKDARISEEAFRYEWPGARPRLEDISPMQVASHAFMKGRAMAFAEVLDLLGASEEVSSDAQAQLPRQQT